MIETDVKLNNPLDKYCLNHKYTKAKTNSGKLTKSGHLECEHGFKSVYKILPYNNNSKEECRNWIHYEHEKTDISKVDFVKLAYLLVKPLT
jgi:hypothetical protein